MPWGTRSVQCYEKIRQVGQGTYGKVYEGRDRTSGKIIALKKIKFNRDKRKRGVPSQTLREIGILRRFHHENLVNMIEVVTSATEEGQYCDNGSLYIVFEYMELDLSGLLDIKYKFSQEEVKCFLRQLLSAMDYLHSQSVCHRDLKCSNILISPNHILKVTDFGLARIMNKGLGEAVRYTNKVITLWYRPPELLLGDVNYNTKVDMWSVGCIFVELLIGTPLLQGKSETDQLKKILELCGVPSTKDWQHIEELPNFRLLDQIQKDTGSISQNPSRPSLSLKPPPGRLPRFLSDAGLERESCDLALHLLNLDPVLRWTASQALNSIYMINAPRPEKLDRMKLPHSSLHEWETKKARKGERPLGDSSVPNRSSSQLGQNRSTPSDSFRGPEPKPLSPRDRSSRPSTYSRSRSRSNSRGRRSRKDSARRSPRPSFDSDREEVRSFRRRDRRRENERDLDSERSRGGRRRERDWSRDRHEQSSERLAPRDGRIREGNESSTNKRDGEHRHREIGTRKRGWSRDKTAERESEHDHDRIRERERSYGRQYRDRRRNGNERRNRDRSNDRDRKPDSSRRRDQGGRPPRKMDEQIGYRTRESSITAPKEDNSSRS